MDIEYQAIRKHLDKMGVLALSNLLKMSLHLRVEQTLKSGTRYPNCEALQIPQYFVCFSRGVGEPKSPQTAYMKSLLFFFIY